jgi:hypothetical protein
VIHAVQKGSALVAFVFVLKKVLASREHFI